MLEGIGGTNGGEKLINWLVGDADGTGSLVACLFGDASELGKAGDFSHNTIILTRLFSLLWIFLPVRLET